MCPRPEPAVMAAALEAGVTKMFRIGGAHAIAALAYGTARVPRVDKIVGPGNRFVAAAKAHRRRRLRDRLLRRSDRNRRSSPAAGAPTGSPRISSRRPSTIRTRDRSSSRGTGARRRRSRAARRRDRRAAATSSSARSPRTARSSSTRDGRRSDGARESHRARASRRRSRVADRRGRSPPARCSSGRSPRRPPATTPPARITCCRPPGAARFRGGLSAADFVRVMSVQRRHARRAEAARADHRAARARRRARRPRRVHRGAAVTDDLKSHYEKPAEMYDGLRLHQNENTAAARRGCSTRWRVCAREQVGFYPPYSAVTARGARLPRRRRRSRRARQRPRRRHHGRGDRATCGRRPAAASCPKPSSRSRRSRSSRSTPRSSAAGSCR